MSGKLVMDYKKQRIGQSEAANSLSIKESHASLNEESDSEKIEMPSHKRKHRVTLKSMYRDDDAFSTSSDEFHSAQSNNIDTDDDEFSSQNLNNFIRQDDTFIKAYHIIERDGYFYGEGLNQQGGDAVSTTSDEFYSVRSGNTDSDEEFYDIEFGDIDEDGKPISINSSYTSIPSKPIPESTTNIVYENPSHNINNIIETSSDDSVPSEEEQDTTSGSESYSSSIYPNSDTFSSDFTSNDVSYTQAVDVVNPYEDEWTDSEDEWTDLEDEISFQHNFNNELEVDELEEDLEANELEEDVEEYELDESEVYELDESEYYDEELAKVEPANENDINNSDGVSMAETSNQDSEDNQSVLSNMHNPAYSSSDEVQSIRESSISSNRDMTEYEFYSMDMTISVSNSLPSLVNVEPKSSAVLEIANEKYHDELEFLLAHIYSSENKSESTIATELLETTDIEMSEMTGIEWSEVADATNTEPREVVSESECIEVGPSLEVMNRSIYNNEICANSGLNDHIATIEHENISFTDIDTSSTEPMVNDRESEFESIKRVAMEMLDKKNAEVLASFDKLANESFDSMVL